MKKFSLLVQCLVILGFLVSGCRMRSVESEAKAAPGKKCKAAEAIEIAEKAVRHLYDLAKLNDGSRSTLKFESTFDKASGSGYYKITVSVRGGIHGGTNHGVYMDDFYCLISEIKHEGGEE